MTDKYDFEFIGTSIGVTATASSIRGAFRILKNEVKYPHKFKLQLVVDCNGSDITTEQHKSKFKRLVETAYIEDFGGKK